MGRTFAFPATKYLEDSLPGYWLLCAGLCPHPRSFQGHPVCAPCDGSMKYLLGYVFNLPDSETSTFHNSCEYYKIDTSPSEIIYY